MLKAVWDILIYLGLTVSFFIVPFTLAFDAGIEDNSILKKTHLWEVLFDVAFMINIALNFITAYQQDIIWKTELKDIAKTYLKSFFIFDIVSTLPCLITN